MADVLMVNVWTKNIGQFHGSNMELLKSIFEVNFKLFGDKEKKRILVVIRDFNAAHDNFANNVNKLRDSFSRIWDECEKPASFQNSQPKDFFKFEFFTLPNKTKKSFEKEWDSRILEMQQRFDIGHENSFFITDH